MNDQTSNIPVTVSDSASLSATPKPRYVYHGSCKGITGPLTPGPQTGDINGDFPEGKRNVVFATDDEKFAALYTLKTPHMLSASEVSGTGELAGTHFGVFRDYDDWKKTLASSACSVYALPSDSFVNTINKRDGHPTKEWMSSQAVQPEQVVRYTPEKVMQKGVQLFFLTPQVEKELWNYDETKGPEHSFMNRMEAKRKAGIIPPSFTGMHLAKELIDAGLMTHLNADAGISPVALPSSPHVEAVREDIQWLKEQVKAKTLSQEKQFAQRSKNDAPSLFSQKNLLVGGVLGTVTLVALMVFSPPLGLLGIALAAGAGVAGMAGNYMIEQSESGRPSASSNALPIPSPARNKEMPGPSQALPEAGITYRDDFRQKEMERRTASQPGVKSY